ncbi:hypothetical protein [Photobacterium jeanii]|uniref:hypothetical protein n=1 Tax=Photobacterium jeanii TaxID=858640 RepID=UPI000A3F4DAD|nr:hypothetical protein [Photobacterium jeanii]
MKEVEFVELLSKIESLDNNQLRTLYLQSKQAYQQHQQVEVKDIVTQEELEMLLHH